MSMLHGQTHIKYSEVCHPRCVFKLYYYYYYYYYYYLLQLGCHPVAVVILHV